MPICFHRQRGRCSRSNCQFRHDGPGGLAARLRGRKTDRSCLQQTTSKLDDRSDEWIGAKTEMIDENIRISIDCHVYFLTILISSLHARCDT